ncbi:MAG: hypothetical protein OXC46_07700 [Thaumarchaeota archaeon]|nr:hypothetical protein [Nitrososphaerota archaeon]
MMYVLFPLLLGVILFGFGTAHSQEPGLATYQETAQILVDKTISQDIKSSITLQSTSVQEIKIPPELEKKIREDGRIGAVILTNEDRCVLGVVDESCVMINIKRNPEDTNFLEIQQSAKDISSMYIDQINNTFDINSEFHSVFVHSQDDTNALLDTSGVVSGGGTISAVYTMPVESTDSMYEKISSILLPREIRESGGFYDVAKNLSFHENAKMTFSIIPINNNSLLQLKVNVDYDGAATDVMQINPSEYLRADLLQRSGYFSAGFYPLNSLLQVVILSPEPVMIYDVKGKILETQEVEGDLVPMSVLEAGWVFDPQEGQKVQGMWIFGKESTISGDMLQFSIGTEEITVDKPQVQFDESVLVPIIIAGAAAAAAIFYLKGYKKSHK